jgi:DNA polymerase-3 subunit delta'
MAKKSKVQAPPPSDAPAPPPPPCRFGDVIGQRAAMKILEDACRAGKLHHCWIFHGPYGVGKFRAALAFAAVVLDPTSESGLMGEFAPDADSQVQKLLKAGVHPDLHVVTKELALFNDEKSVRESKLLAIPKQVIEDHVIEPAKLSATLKHTSLASKVFIIDEAELLNLNSQNALLKTLEEPPESTIIILVTSNESALLPTIRSRGQRVFFQPLAERDMHAWLKTISDPPEGEESGWLMSFAAGSPGAFRAARDARLFEWWGTLGPVLAKLRAGSYTPEAGAMMADFADTYAEAWVKNHDNASKQLANQYGADWIFKILTYWLGAELRRSTSSKDPASVLHAIEAVHRAERLMGSNVGVGVVMEEMVSSIAAGFAGERQFIA